MKKSKDFLVTKPVLPDINDYQKMLKKIWASGQLSNFGEFHNELEARLKDYLNVKNISLFSNGTLALIASLSCLNLRGEVITTPFSFIATAQSIKWAGLEPKFVDIDYESCNIDPNLIEDAITSNTSAIMGVHCYGNPCRVNEIKKISDKHNLKVIYDAAHCFGVEFHRDSILNYGDMSAISFHPTKVFNTFEGGAVISNSPEMKAQLDKFRNFNLVNTIPNSGIGMNAKLAEPNCAFGLLVLNQMNHAIEKRVSIVNRYIKNLSKTQGIDFLEIPEKVKQNGSYMPIFINDKFSRPRDEVFDHLQKNNIYSRKYFFPLINEVEPFFNQENSKDKFPNSFRRSREVLCLPIYPSLQFNEIDYICEKLLEI